MLPCFPRTSDWTLDRILLDAVVSFVFVVVVAAAAAAAAAAIAVGCGFPGGGDDGVDAAKRVSITLLAPFGGKLNLFSTLRRPKNRQTRQMVQRRSRRNSWRTPPIITRGCYSTGLDFSET